MRPIKTSKFYLSSIFPVFLISTPVFVLTQFSPNIWLSEYGYIRETSEKFNQVSFPVNQNETSFCNSFLSKADTDVTVYGNLSFIVLTCEAEYPISWFVIQELKTTSDTLRTETYEFQSLTNGSDNQQTYFKSIMFIHLDQFDYYSVEESYHPIYPGKWKFYCQKATIDKKSFQDPSINLILKESETTEIFRLSQMKLEEKIIIAVLTNHSASSNFTGFSLSDVMRHYPNFYANKDQQVIMAKNFSINFEDYEDALKENSKLVDYEHGEEIMEGVIIQILCYSSKNLYSYGTLVEIVWTNGTKIRIPEKIYTYFDKPEIRLSNSSKKIGKNLFEADGTSAEEDMLYFISEEIVVDLGMKQVDCYMPVWANGKWDKVTREFNVSNKNS